VSDRCNESFTAYVEALRALATGGVEFVVIGSFGFELLLPAALAREPSDCDIVVRTPDGGLDLAAIEGKTYARARLDALQIDLVYEQPEPGFDWDRDLAARSDDAAT